MRAAGTRAARLIVLLVAGDAALAQHASPLITGYAYAIDGAALRIGNLSIQLAGLQAPGLDTQLPDRHGQTFPVGLFARDVLAALIAEQVVGCRALKPANDSTFMIAVCASPAAPDLGLAVLKRGWAILAEQDGKPDVPGYAPIEAEARQHRRGLWQGGDVRPLAGR